MAAAPKRREEGSGKLAVAAALRLLFFFAITSAVFAIESPVVQPFSIPRSLRFGDRLQVTCTIIRGDLPLTFQWFRNGHLVPASGGRVTAKPFDQFSSVLVVPGITAVDVGNYTCTVSNAAGSDSNTAILQVEAPPEWVMEPQDQMVVLGSEATFHCKVVGFPQPKITWLRDRGSGNGDFQVIRSDTRRTVLADGSLVILRAASGDNGYYRCEADNGIGAKLAKLVRLTVRTPPKMLEGYQMLTLRRGENALLRCIAVGDPPLVATWIKEPGNIISDTGGSGHRYVVKHKVGVEGVETELSIARVTKDDAGVFTCRVSNDVGKDDGKIDVEILEPPGAPISVSASEITSRSARLSWRPAETMAPTHLTSYVIRYWKNGGGSKKLEEVAVPGPTETSFYLKDLSPGVTYTGQVLAQNTVGISEPSKSARFRTLDEVPSGPPTDVTAEAIGSTAVLVSWKAPPMDLCNGLLKGYYVGHKVADSVHSYSYQTTSTSIGSSESLLITGLKLNTKYAFVVKAFNAAGSGPGSQETIVRTREGNPPRPPTIALSEISPTSAKISWKQPYISLVPVTHYLLQFRSGDSGAWQNLHIPGQRHEFLVRPLIGNHRYVLRLAAYNKYGKGNFSLPLTINTDPDPLPGSKGIHSAPPLYAQPRIVVSVAAAIVVIVTAVSITWVCYKKNFGNPSASALPQIPDAHRASVAQSEGGYCDISRLPLYLHPGVAHGMALTATLRRRANEDMYDIPWDATMQTATLDRTSGSYTRLKSGHNPRASVASTSANR